MKRLWKVGLASLAISLLMLACALFVRPNLSDGLEDHMSPGRAHHLDDVELTADRHYRFSFSERMPLLDRRPQGVTRLEVYLEPLLEHNIEIERDRAVYLARSELAGIAELEVDCDWDGTRATKCSIDSSDHFDFAVAADGLYRVRIHNTGNRTANFLEMRLERILLDWWIPLILLALAAVFVVLLWRRSDGDTRWWVFCVALLPWRWRRPSDRTSEVGDPRSMFMSRIP